MHLIWTLLEGPEDKFQTLAFSLLLIILKTNVHLLGKGLKAELKIFGLNALKKVSRVHITRR